MKLACLGSVGGLHLLAVPVQGLAGAKWRRRPEADLGEVAAGVEVGVGLALAATGIDPFLVMAAAAGRVTG